MKININEKVLNSEGKPIIFQKIDCDLKGSKEPFLKEMTIFDSIVIALNNTEKTSDLEKINKIADLNNLLIEFSTKKTKSNEIEIKSNVVANFLKEIILNDCELSNLIKAYVLSKITI